MALDCIEQLIVCNVFEGFCDQIFAKAGTDDRRRCCRPTNESRACAALPARSSPIRRSRKTIEAGLVVREMLLRKRIDFIVVLAPPSMTIQWQDELAAKFGLSFEIIDRDLLAELRRKRGFGANPWAAGSRFILSHKLLGDEAYTAGLREVLGSFQARSLLILDEAHHCAPAGGGRYAIESQFTKAVRDIADRFEHRLFLSATPHNGHPNSFATLLEILDPQRFTRGMDVREDELAPVMVRRLKADLRALGEAFPERIVQRVALSGLAEDQPELVLAKMLSDYGAFPRPTSSAINRFTRGSWSAFLSGASWYASILMPARKGAWKSSRSEAVELFQRIVRR